MKSEEDVIIDKTLLGEEQIEIFDWEDHLYESWLEKQREHKRNRSGDAGVSV